MDIFVINNLSLSATMETISASIPYELRWSSSAYAWTHRLLGTIELNIMTMAGIKEAPSIIITTHDDPTNIYLTIYCRRLRPDIQIICRAKRDGNISKLHTVGADLVMSSASLAANTILNLLKPDDVLMLTENLNVFRAGMHSSFLGKSLVESQIRMQTGCSVIAINHDGEMVSNPDPSVRFSEKEELIMIGTDDAEKRFFKMYA